MARMDWEEVIKTRVYRNLPDILRPTVRGYYAYWQLAISIASAYFDISSTDDDGHPNAYGAILSAGEVNAPLIHVPEELGKAFLATEVSDCFSIDQIPYPVFILNLPRGLLLGTGGAKIMAIVVAKASCIAQVLAKGVEVDDPDIFNLLGSRTVRAKEMPFNGELVIVGLHSDGGYEFADLTISDMVKVTNAELANTVLTGFESEPFQPKALTEITRIALNSILLLQHRPELLSEEQAPLVGQKNKGFADKTIKGTIRWLAKSYRRKTFAASQEDQATGRTVAPHWRKGHWHNVPCGKGRKERKMMWFEPVYVNGPTKARAEAA